ncbi:MAG: DUF5606 domain-containing protein [Bacteroidales bacterium]|jgi:hypothetical protein|nr:DUF5606 domain-containing protein [Bacteroidales bacterium]
MELKKILTISGKNGLFQIVVQGKDRIIVESLNDKSRFPVFPSHKVSSLEEICIFTETEEIPLKEVLKNIFIIENGNKCIDPKSENNALKLYMEKILPSYDKNRVYVSDMKKLFTWYNTLHENHMLSFEEEVNKESQSAEKE